MPIKIINPKKKERNYLLELKLFLKGLDREALKWICIVGFFALLIVIAYPSLLIVPLAIIGLPIAFVIVMLANAIIIFPIVKIFKILFDR